MFVLALVEYEGFRHGSEFKTLLSNEKFFTSGCDFLTFGLCFIIYVSFLTMLIKYIAVLGTKDSHIFLGF